MAAKRSVYACDAVAISGNAKSIASSERPNKVGGRPIYYSTVRRDNHLSRKCRGFLLRGAGNRAFSSGYALEEIKDFSFETVVTLAGGNRRGLFKSVRAKEIMRPGSGWHLRRGWPSYRTGC